MATIAHNVEIEFLDDQKRRIVFSKGLWQPVVPELAKSIVTPIGPYSWSLRSNNDSVQHDVFISNLFLKLTGRPLSGSLKTKRLRKKRSKALTNWLTDDSPRKMIPRV